MNRYLIQFMQKYLQNTLRLNQTDRLNRYVFLQAHVANVIKDHLFEYKVQHGFMVSFKNISRKNVT